MFDPLTSLGAVGRSATAPEEAQAEPMRRACPPSAIRIPVAVWIASTVWLCLTPGAGAARQVPTQASPGVAVPRVVISGDVVDGRRLVALSGAVIQLVDTATGHIAASTESDEEGHFRLVPVPVGTYGLSIVRLGYQAASGTIWLDASEDPSLVVTMAPDDVDLEPVLVTVGRPLTRLREFEQRKVIGNGTFITRADIEALRPLLVTDLFRTLPGVRVAPGLFGNTLTLRDGCRPNLYFDGVAVDEALSLDLSLRPDDIEAIEVHSTASAPAQYSRNACGVILVYTREPVRVRGRSAWWKPLALAGGVLGLKLLFGR